VSDQIVTSTLHVLNNIARARGMMWLANDAGMTRAGLYKALAPNAKPSFQTVQKIAKALGCRLTFTRAA
jgi:probable addiction module antidote protein